jgi:hypothetical protein
MEKCTNDARFTAAHPCAQVVELGWGESSRQLLVVSQLSDVNKTVEGATAGRRGSQWQKRRRLLVERLSETGQMSALMNSRTLVNALTES